MLCVFYPNAQIYLITENHLAHVTYITMPVRTRPILFGRTTHVQVGAIGHNVTYVMRHTPQCNL